MVYRIQLDVTQLTPKDTAQYCGCQETDIQCLLVGQKKRMKKKKKIKMIQ